MHLESVQAQRVARATTAAPAALLKDTQARRGADARLGPRDTRRDTRCRGLGRQGGDARARTPPIRCGGGSSESSGGCSSSCTGRGLCAAGVSVEPASVSATDGAALLLAPVLLSGPTPPLLSPALLGGPAPPPLLSSVLLGPAPSSPPSSPPPPLAPSGASSSRPAPSSSRPAPPDNPAPPLLLLCPGPVERAMSPPSASASASSLVICQTMMASPPPPPPPPPPPLKQQASSPRVQRQSRGATSTFDVKMSTPARRSARMEHAVMVRAAWRRCSAARARGASPSCTISATWLAPSSPDEALPSSWGSLASVTAGASALRAAAAINAFRLGARCCTSDGSADESERAPRDCTAKLTRCKLIRGSLSPGRLP